MKHETEVEKKARQAKYAIYWAMAGFSLLTLILGFWAGALRID